MDMSRRSFIVSTTAAAAAGAALAQAQAEAQPAPAQPMPAPMPRGFNPSDPALKYELVIAGGEVLDPSLRLRGKRDIGIKNGQIAAVPASGAATFAHAALRLRSHFIDRAGWRARARRDAQHRLRRRRPLRQG